MKVIEKISLKIDNLFVIERLAQHLSQVLTLKQMYSEIKDLVAKDEKKSSLLGQNIEYFNNVEVNLFNFFNFPSKLAII